MVLLGGYGRYVELKHRQLVGLFLVVLVKQELYEFVSDADITTECTGGGWSVTVTVM